MGRSRRKKVPLVVEGIGDLHVQNMNASGPEIRVIEAPASPDEVERNALAKQANVLANQAQEEALQRLKTRLNRSRIRVIEIHLVGP